MTIGGPHYDWWNRPPERPYIPEEHELLVEQAHIKTARLIKSFRDAGVRLQEYRKEQYDYGEGVDVPEDASDPTRDMDFDLADGSRMQEEAGSRLHDAKTKAEAKAEAKKAVKEESKVEKEEEKATEETVT